MLMLWAILNIIVYLKFDFYKNKIGIENKHAVVRPHIH